MRGVARRTELDGRKLALTRRLREVLDTEEADTEPLVLALIGERRAFEDTAREVVATCRNGGRDPASRQ